MELLGVAVNAVVVSAAGLSLWWVFRGRFAVIEARLGGVDHRIQGLEARIDDRMSGLGTRIDGLEARIDHRIDGLEARIDHRIDGLEARIEKRMDGLQTSVDALRSDLTAVALAVGAHQRTGEAGR